jgi:hypothetical protein
MRYWTKNSQAGWILQDFKYAHITRFLACLAYRYSLACNIEAMPPVFGV